MSLPRNGKKYWKLNFTKIHRYHIETVITHKWHKGWDHTR